MFVSRVRPRFFAFWEGDIVEFSTVMERAWSGQAEVGLKWWANIQAKISARHAEMRVATWVSEGGRRKVVECHPHSNDRRDHVRI